jgi:hypothetical protein
MRVALAIAAACGVALSFAALPQSEPTFGKDVAPIVFSKCFPCHSQTGCAPFPLASYDDVKKRAQQIARTVSLRFMPPIIASSDFVSSFTDVPTMSEEDIATVVAWAESGAKPGRTAPAPAAPSRDWKLGKPDAVFSVGRGTSVRQDGQPYWLLYCLPNPLEDGKYVGAFEVRAKSAPVVRQTMVMFGPNSSRETVAETNGFTGISAEQFLGVCAPGCPPSKFPPSVGRRVSEKDGLAVQVLYTPNGRAESAEVEVAVYYNAAAKEETTWLTTGNENLDIAAGAIWHNEFAELELPFDMRLVSFIPQARLLCKKFSVIAQMPDRTSKTVFSSDPWSPYWVGSYRFPSMPLLPKGTVLKAFAQYDNSSHGGVNPNPQRVKSGAGKKDELFLAHFELLRVR